MTLSQQEQQTLCQAAENAAKSAYAPYSKFRVGAAILGGQKIYVGTNIENTSFGLSLCAERAAFAHAIANGEREFKAIAIACIDTKNTKDINSIMPCGACRQWIAELAPQAEIIVSGVTQVFSLNDLLPFSFHLNSFQKCNF